MKFHKALKLLRNGKVKAISNIDIGMIAQTLETLQYWFCEQPDKEQRIKNYQNCMFSDKWEVSSFE